MTTPSHTLRETIERTLAAAHPQPVRVQEIHRAVATAVTFDAEDLAPVIVRGEPISEPSWRRNVRNVLQHGKRAGTLVNITHGAWRLPTPDPRIRLDAEGAWEAVRSAAEKALQHGVIYRSAKQERRYRMIEVGVARVVIQRLDAPAPATLTAGVVQLATRYLNAAGGRVGRQTLISTVAEEVSLVYLHPRLKWSDDGDWIEVTGVEAGIESAKPVYEDFGEAPDDDPARLAQFARRVRRGQPKFRRNLLALYGGRCAISGWGPDSVLEAAHILVHRDYGLNNKDNGILLRADLHSLFDDGLLKIDPATFTVVLDPSLADTPYWALHGTTLRPRMDASQPSREYLRQRWESGPATQG